MRKDRINPAHIHLRPASNDDLDFIFRFRLLTMKKYIEKARGWNEKEQREYATDYLEKTQIIMINNVDVGVLKILKKDNKLVIHQIQILPEYQRAGIGTSLIRKDLDKERRESMPVTLTGLKCNPEKSHYERLGFRIVEEFKNNYRMEWNSCTSNRII